ncbi:gliding motility lipoprotein GldD [Dysgonomonas termitidis]|jgi:gliding motility-associated lipoprotein GldD
MNMGKQAALFLIICCIFVSCNEYTPKPVGYPRIDREESGVVKYGHPAFSFLYSANARIEEVENGNESGFWFNIIYPAYDAIIYCTYMPVDKKKLSGALEVSYQLAYSHALKANGIRQSQYTDSLHHTSGIIYDIGGPVASPVQFYLTDNTSNFLRGSLYFNQQANSDSIAPVIGFLREDIVALMESLEWKNSKNGR